MSLYRTLCSVVGPLAMALGAVLLLSPALYLSLYVPQVTAGMVFPAQRFAPAIIGLGAVLFLLRDLEAGRLASRFAAVTAAVWAGVAATGLWHYTTAEAGPTIVLAAMAELALAAAFAIAAWRHR